MKTKHFIFLLIIVFISRIPLFITGFGVDGDAWYFAQTSLRLWNEGVYNVSRFPGFPIFEVLNAPIIGIGGSFASNFATFIFFIVSLYIFKQIVQHLKLQFPYLIITSFAFFPIIWKNSAITMDYMWGLCGILVSFLLILKKRFIWAGILLGLAAGTRISHIVFILPFLFLFESEKRNQWFVFVVVAIFTSFICYLPVMIFSSTSQNISDDIYNLLRHSFLERIAFFLYRLIYSIGILGFGAVIFICFLNRKKFIGLFSSNIFKMSSASIFLLLFLFFLAPFEREYLLPMMPFLLILIFLIGNKKEIIITSVLLLSYSFFTIDVIEHSVKSPKPKLGIYQGFLLKEINERLENAEWKERVSSIEVPDSSIIMTGVGPLLGLLNPQLQVDEKLEEYLSQDCYLAVNKNEVYYVYGLNYNQLIDMRDKGFIIYYLDTSKDYLETFIGYELDRENVLRIVIN